MKLITPTLAICMIGAIIVIGGLFRGASTPAPVAAGQPAPVTTESPYGNAAPADSATAATPAAAPAQAARMTIEGFAFGGDLVVPAGQSVTVINSDSAPHTATANDGAFDTGNVNAGAEGALVAPAVPGTYAFFCVIHPSMTANLVVQ